MKYSRVLSRRTLLRGAGTVVIGLPFLEEMRVRSVYAAPGQLGITSWLLPWLVPFTDRLGPRDVMALGEGLLSAALLLGLSVILEQVSRRLARAKRLALPAG